MVRGAGIEPARPYGHDILSVARLPITTSAQVQPSYFYHDVWVEGYDNLDKVYVGSLNDYHYGYHSCDLIPKECDHHLIVKPNHIARILVTLTHSRRVFF